MSCLYCGFQLTPEQTTCPNCHQSSSVTVLSPTELENFDGLTIEQIKKGAESQNSQTATINRHIYVRRINLNSLSGNLLTKLIIGSLILLIIIVALPLALLFISFLTMSWLIAKTGAKH